MGGAGYIGDSPMGKPMTVPDNKPERMRDIVISHAVQTRNRARLERLQFLQRTLREAKRENANGALDLFVSKLTDTVRNAKKDVIL
jgi:hypothetical protein